MYGGILWGTVYSIHTSYRFDWILTSVSSFYRGYFINCLRMCLHLFGFNRTEHHLIMESVDVIIWTGHFQTFGLGVVGPSLGFLDPLIYLLWVFSVGCHEEPYAQYARQFWYGPDGKNIHQCCYDPWNPQYFRTCPPIQVVLVPCVHTCQKSQFRKLLYHTFYFLFSFCVIKSFILHFVVWPYCLYVSLSR